MHHLGSAVLYWARLQCNLLTWAATCWTTLQLLSYEYALLYCTSPVLECWIVRHPISLVPGWKEMPIPEPVRYRNKETQSGIGTLQYRTELMDAGIPMPAASALMPMSSYEDTLGGCSESDIWGGGRLDPKTLPSTSSKASFGLFHLLLKSFSVGLYWNAAYEPTTQR